MGSTFVKKWKKERFLITNEKSNFNGVHCSAGVLDAILTLYPIFPKPHPRKNHLNLYDWFGVKFL